MSSKYPGGFITKSPVAPTTSAASGVWTLDQAMQYTKAGTWPTPVVYIQDIFAATTYTGNGSTQTITNSIDLVSNAGLVWVKNRTTADGHALYDTTRGVNNKLATDATTAQTASGGITAFSSTGFSLDSLANVNRNANSLVAWTFRKAPKFFDVVTYTGNGATGRTISHSLGITPGFIIIKRTDSTSDWAVCHCHDGTVGHYGFSLNTANSSRASGPVYHTSTLINLDTVTTYTNFNVAMNVNGATYVAYVFASNTAANGLIQCGTLLSDANGRANVTLGWQPQFVLYKNIDFNGPWLMDDTARGWTSTGWSDLVPNTSNAEVVNALPYWFPTATGMSSGVSFGPFMVSSTYIYVAIRNYPYPV
jgi:hypothetical protein